MMALDEVAARRSAAAKKGAISRKRVLAARDALREALSGGKPLPMPEMGSQTDRVMTGPQIGELIARIRAATLREDAA